jgi:hypothetical protein
MTLYSVLQIDSLKAKIAELESKCGGENANGRVLIKSHNLFAS